VQVRIDRGNNYLSKNIEQIDLELAGFQVKNASAEGIKFNLGKDVTASTVKKITLTTRRFEVEGLPVEEMQITLEGLRFNLWRAMLRHKLEILEVKKGEGRILLQEAGLNSFLAPRLETLQEPKIKLQDGKIEVSGRVKTRLGFSYPIVFSSRLEPLMGRIELTEPKLKVSVLPVPALVTRRIVENINPVVDLNQYSDLPCIFRITKLQIDPTGLSAQADLIFKCSSPSAASAPRGGAAPSPTPVVAK
jgi:hypothetical protein